MQQRRETKLVDFVVHIPTGLAYAWIFLGFVTAGMLVYTAVARVVRTDSDVR